MVCLFVFLLFAAAHPLHKTARAKSSSVSSPARAGVRALNIFFLRCVYIFAFSRLAPSLLAFTGDEGKSKDISVYGSV